MGWLPSLVGESFRLASASRVMSSLVGIVALSIPVAVLGTAGLGIEAQSAILRRVDDVGARTLTLISTAQFADLPASAVKRISRLEGVNWVVGLGPVIDVQLPDAVGEPTPMRVYEAVNGPVRFGSSSRELGAFISQTSAGRLGLAGAYSVLEPARLSVVGWFAASDPLQALDAFVLLPSTDEGRALERIIVSVEDVGWTDAVAANLDRMLGVEGSRSATVERSDALIAARRAVEDEVVQRDRLLVVLLMAGLTIIACVVVLAGTSLMRRDFGRRRALGASQLQLTVLVMASTLWPTVVGTSVGTVIGYGYLASVLGGVTDNSFPLAVAILVVVGLVSSSSLPAAFAATRDPLRVLRVP